MRFVTYEEVIPWFKGKTVAIVGSGPGVLDNAPGFVDSHEVVLRVNNYRLSIAAGSRCDVFYSFLGGSIRKERSDLMRDGVRLVMCKCPNAQFIDSSWHRRNKQMNGVDFRYIYDLRASWFWCDTYIPDVPEFMWKFELLRKHVPTTGFAALLDVIGCGPKSIFLTGFDGFRSGIHNTDQVWRAKNEDDPIGHVPEFELERLKAYMLMVATVPITPDARLGQVLRGPDVGT